jgi:hypothetical protein
MSTVVRLTRWGRGQVAAKLGRCTRCMRASLQGAAGAGALAGAAALAGLAPVLVGLLALVAAGFGGLVVAHAVAYVVRPLPAGGPCCGQRPPRLVLRRPVLQAVLSLPSAFGLTQVLALSRAAAQTALAPPATPHQAVFSTELTCPGGAGGAPCTCTFTATFGYDYRQVSPTKKRLTHFTMQWGQGSTGTCAPSIERGSGAFDFQCVGDKQPCKLTGGNVFACPCGTTIQYVPLTGSQKECLCPNQDNKRDYAQGVCGAPVWIDKACEFEWLDLNFQHKVTCGCPDGHISRGFLTVVATFRDGVLSFGGDYKPARSR